MAFGVDFMKLLGDPNIQQAMGNAGAELAGPGSFAAAINPSDLIRRQANQKALREMLGVLGGGDVQPSDTEVDTGALHGPGFDPGSAFGTGPGLDPGVGFGLRPGAGFGSAIGSDSGTGLWGWSWD